MSELSQEELKSLSEKRDERCRPVAKTILELILKHDLLVSDVNYVHALVKQELEVVFKSMVVQHMNEIFELVQKSLDESIRLAQVNLWGKDPSDVKLADVDKVLKKKKIPKEG